MATKTDKKWKAFLIGIWFRVRNHDFVYRRILNRKYKFIKSSIQEASSVREKVISDLEHFGFSLTSISELIQGSPDLFEKMETWIKDNEVNLKQKKRKKFLFSYYGTENVDKPLEIDNPIVNFFLRQSVLEIVCSYLGYVPQLFEVYIEKTMPIGSEAPTFSQNWHRDPEEKRTLKVFLYLSDVGQDSGPFTYISGSAPTLSGAYSKLFPQELPHGCYPDPVEVDQKVKPKDMLSMTGSRGTVIFCDTAGIHKGGHATKSSRIMATAFFPSKRYSLQKQFKTPSLSVFNEAQLNHLAREVLDVN